MKLNLVTGEKLKVVSADGFYNLSPDGREVVFRRKDGSINIAALNGGKIRELYRDSTRYFKLNWTRDGRYIMALVFSNSDKTDQEIWRFPSQGGIPMKLDLSFPKIWSFDLSTDNRRFAFSTYEGSKSELWVMENFLPK